MTTLKITCAWCGKDCGTKDGQGVEGETSTICTECAKKMEVK
jgi:CRISPR/Cas system-associated protein Cas10 (large subunit of type III CRISPR-Cas system)